MGKGRGVNIDVAMAGRGTPDMGCVVELVVGREGRGRLPAQEGRKEVAGLSVLGVSSAVFLSPVVFLLWRVSCCGVKAL